jgi:hypothetical protein
MRLGEEPKELPYDTETRREKWVFAGRAISEHIWSRVWQAAADPESHQNKVILDPVEQKTQNIQDGPWSEKVIPRALIWKTIFGKMEPEEGDFLGAFYVAMDPGSLQKLCQATLPQTHLSLKSGRFP